MSGKKLHYGVGVNDADYRVNNLVNGLWEMCPFYAVWKDMLKRVYSAKSLAKFPTYLGCSVSEDWRSFSKFKSWMETQDWEGKQLDKDLLVAENKIYSPETCVFISRAINNVFGTGCRLPDSPLPLGVAYAKIRKGFIARTYYREKRVTSPLCSDAYQAHRWWQEFKLDQIKQLALEQPEPIYSALMLKAGRLASDLANNLETLSLK